jgi:predicted aldo/keto reductase-like oxidoreductase
VQYRALGKTDVSVSVLGFGSMHIEASSQRAVNRLVANAVDLGINLIHSDYNYAACVEKTGEALRALGSRRHSIFLVAAGHPPDPIRFRSEFEGMFKRLGVDHIDLFQLSGVSDNGRLDRVLAPGGSLEILQQARQAGRIRYIGISSHGDGSLVEKIVRTGRFDTIMVPYNFSGFHLEGLRRLPIPAFRDLDPPLALAYEEGMGVLAIKVLAGGLLSQVPSGHLQGLLVRPLSIAPHVAIRHVLSKPYITSAVIGMASKQELAQNVRAVEDLGPLTVAETASAQAAAQDLFSQYCVRCGLCLPCPVKIDIPEIFRLEYRAISYPLAWVRELAAEKWDALEAKPHTCSDCGDCLPRCPYHLPIPDLIRAAESKVKAFRAGGQRSQGHDIPLSS